MELKTYINQLTKEQLDAFATRCETSAGHLRNIAYGYKPCGEDLAMKIDFWSDGSVTAEELRPDLKKYWAHIRATKKDKLAPV